ncbi:MAG: UDP-N-acetylmuramoyl-tripeptide--D-alanyl-D-alanine ligase [Armatimonadetes bacterium]|nr:UDP-N-acetylmuramoyl-tripeptide--D-alanyl-D-alanine ligase [Armatimonadota bacterium]
MRCSEFARRCGGAWSGPGDPEITGFATDSRDAGLGSLFIAIKGDRVDGHAFVAAAASQGAVACLVERDCGIPQITVDDVESALAAFGRSLRAEFHGPVVGITGSNGKTTVKEFTAAALHPLGTVLKTIGNKNTQYTSPLLWAGLTPDTKAVVVEMGMRGFGQIRHLAGISLPTVGVVTVIGTAHIEKVGSREGIFRAKSELLEALPADGVAIVWREDDFFPDLAAVPKCRTLSFGASHEADCQVVGYRSDQWGKCTVRLAFKGHEAEVDLPTFGRHQALNAAAAALAATCCGVDFTQAVEGLASADLPGMRLEVLVRQGVTVLVDTYNASPDSTVAALEALAQGPAQGRRLAVLGEMKELGDFTERGHRLVGQALAHSGVDRALLTGGPTRYIYDEARSAGMKEADMTSLDELDLHRVRAFLDGLEPGDTVLIKGSRALGLESVLEGWLA